MKSLCFVYTYVFVSLKCELVHLTSCNVV